MDFSYQMIAVQGTLVGTAMIILYMLLGAPIVKLKERKLREELKQLRKLSKKAKKEAADDEPEEQVEISPPALVPVTVTPTVEHDDANTPIYFEGKWYASVDVAAQLLDRSVDAIRDGCSTKQDGKSLWDPDGHFEVAVRHRTFPIDGSAQSLVISDYRLSEGSPKMVSRGFVQQGRERIRIDVEDQETGPHAVQFFKDAAKSALLGL